MDREKRFVKAVGRKEALDAGGERREQLSEHLGDTELSAPFWFFEIYRAEHRCGEKNAEEQAEEEEEERAQQTPD